MLATRTTTGSGAAVTHTECGRERARDPPRDDRVLLAVLLAAQQLLAQVVVDRRVGAAPDRAGERDGAGALALAADEQLRAGGHERRRRRGRRRTRSTRERLAQHRRGSPPGSCGAGACTSTSRASTTFSSSPARIRSHRARDRLLVVRRAASR